LKKRGSRYDPAYELLGAWNSGVWGAMEPKTKVLPNSIEEWLGSLSSPRYGSNNWYALSKFNYY
jgi:hypothetical protein